MSISLLSGKTQPYGLLSSNAYVPMNIDGKRYTSVTEYVYSNLFTNPATKGAMEKVTKNYYSSALKLLLERNSQNFIDALIFGTRARYAQDPSFRSVLKDLGNVPTKVTWGNADENRCLHMLFNQLRFSPEQVFFDDNYGEVPFERVNAVVVGVANALKDNPNIPSEPFSILESKYSVRNAQPQRNLVMSLDKLDEIVPVLKIKLKDVIFNEEIVRFKKHLLDVTLDYILKTNYPMLSRSQYTLAKQQQIAKEKSLISRYEDQLYNLYIIGDLPDEIIDDLDFQPVFPSSTNVTVEAVEEQEKQEASVEVKTMEAIDVPKSLLPDAPARIHIKGVEYPSVMAYAFSILFSTIGVTTFNPNDSREKMAHDYVLFEHNLMASRLTELNEKGTRVKFATNQCLVELLLESNGNRLIFTDMDDSVLGIGKPTGSNRAGVFLEFLRNEYSRGVNVVRPFKSPYSNIVVKEWFSSRAADYANTMKMFQYRTIEDIALIYDINPENVDVDHISAESTVLMSAAGLNENDQKIALPFMAADFVNIQAFGVPGLCKTFNLNNPTQHDRELAEETLKEMFKLVKKHLFPEINRNKFVAIMLSNQQIYDVNQTQWWRVNKLAQIGRRRASVK